VIAKRVRLKKNLTRGSFAGSLRYARGLSGERSAVEWSRGIFEPAFAAEEMDAMAKPSRAFDPVEHWVISYAARETPTHREMADDVERLLRRIGIDDDHQYVALPHTDTDHLHLHVIANRVGPDGRASKMSFSGARSHEAMADIAVERDYDVVKSPFVKAQAREQAKRRGLSPEAFDAYWASAAVTVTQWKAAEPAQPILTAREKGRLERTGEAPFHVEYAEAIQRAAATAATWEAFEVGCKVIGIEMAITVKSGKKSKGALFPGVAFGEIAGQRGASGSAVRTPYKLLRDKFGEHPTIAAALMAAADTTGSAGMAQPKPPKPTLQERAAAARAAAEAAHGTDAARDVSEGAMVDARSNRLEEDRAATPEPASDDASLDLDVAPRSPAATGARPRNLSGFNSGVAAADLRFRRRARSFRSSASAKSNRRGKEVRSAQPTTLRNRRRERWATSEPRMRGNVHASTSLAENHSLEKVAPGRAPLSNDDFKTLDQLIATLRTKNRRIIAQRRRERVSARDHAAFAQSPIDSASTTQVRSFTRKRPVRATRTDSITTPPLTHGDGRKRGLELQRTRRRRLRRAARKERSAMIDAAWRAERATRTAERHEIYKNKKFAGAAIRAFIPSRRLKRVVLDIYRRRLAYLAKALGPMQAERWRKAKRELLAQMSTTPEVVSVPKSRSAGGVASTSGSVTKPAVVDRRAGRHQAEINTDDHVSFRKPRMPTPEATPINSPPSRRTPPGAETLLPAVEASAGFRFPPPVEGNGVKPPGPNPVPPLSKVTPASLPASARQPVAPALDAEGAAKPSVASVLARALSGAASSLTGREHDLNKVTTHVLPAVGNRPATAIAFDAPPRERETALANWIGGARAAGITFSLDATAAVAQFERRDSALTESQRARWIETAATVLAQGVYAPAAQLGRTVDIVVDGDTSRDEIAKGKALNRVKGRDPGGRGS
jgi:hypothetical protein